MIDGLSLTLADGTILAVHVDGPEGAPCVVFANSVLTDLSVWDAQARALAGRYRVVRYDQRGHGASEAFEGKMDFDRYGADLLAVMDAAGVEKCAVVGLSMGCPTALAAVAAAPHRFVAFVAVDGVMRSAPGRDVYWTERREIALNDGMQAIADTTVSRWLAGEPADTDISIRLEKMILGTSSAGFAAATYALSSYDHSTALTCPILGIAGAEDGPMPDAVAEHFGQFPGAQIVIIPDAGHLPNFQNPEAFNAVLLAFLEDKAFPTPKETV